MTPTRIRETPEQRRFNDGVLMRRNHVEWFADLGEEMIAFWPKRRRGWRCEASPGMVAIYMPDRRQVVYLSVVSDRHPKDIARDESANLVDFVRGGWVAPLFDENDLPPAYARPKNLIPLARMNQAEVDCWVYEYNRIVADTKFGQRFPRKTWPDHLWCGVVDVLPCRQHVELTLVPVALTVILAVPGKGSWNGSALRMIRPGEALGGWIYAQLDCSVDRDPIPTVH